MTPHTAPTIADNDDDGLTLARIIGRAQGKLELALLYDRHPLSGDDWRAEVRGALALLEAAYTPAAQTINHGERG